MTKFEKLMERIKQHPADWVNSGIGLATAVAAAACAPPEVLNLAKKIMRHAELMRQIFEKHDQDLEWIHSDEGRLLLAEALSVAPPEIQAMMDAKLRELDMLPEATMCDDDGKPVYTLTQIAEKMGGTVEDVKQTMDEIKAHHPTAFEHTGAVHRLQ